MSRHTLLSFVFGSTRPGPNNLTTIDAAYLIQSLAGINALKSASLAGQDRCMDEETKKSLLPTENDCISDEQAAEIWNEFFPKLAGIARKKLGALPRRASDEEDVVLSAMNSFFVGVKKGRFEITDRSELWRLLITITARKAAKHCRQHFAQKRGGGQVRGESVFLNPNGDEQIGIGRVAGSSEVPCTVEQVERVCEELFDQLDDEKLKQTAMLRMEGYSNQEISDQMGCSKSRTKQRISRIKQIWSTPEDR